MRFFKNPNSGNTLREKKRQNIDQPSYFSPIRKGTTPKHYIYMALNPCVSPHLMNRTTNKNSLVQWLITAFQEKMCVHL